LRGTPAGELPIEDPTTIELVINLKTAKALGIDLPFWLLAQANILSNSPLDDRV
jgi:putative ABC transport system substrate-binding protein